MARLLHEVRRDVLRNKSFLPRARRAVWRVRAVSPCTDRLFEVLAQLGVDLGDSLERIGQPPLHVHARPFRSLAHPPLPSPDAGRPRQLGLERLDLVTGALGASLTVPLLRLLEFLAQLEQARAVRALRLGVEDLAAVAGIDDLGAH